MHAFNLAIRALTNENSHVYDEALRKVIDEASRLSRHFKDLKNGTCLRQLTPVVPKLACPTRWSGNLDAVVRYDRLRKYYKDAMNNPDCAYIKMIEGEDWDYIVTSKKKLLKSIGNNMMAIQSSKLKLAAVFRSFETILSRKQQWKNVRLDESYLDLTNLIYQDRAFIRGVIKIQHRSIQILQPEERHAVTMLTKERPDHTTEEIAEDGEINLLDFVREDHDDVDYKNCNFILAGAGEVERLWSKITNLLVDNRLRMSPTMISSIMILKENRSL